MRAGVDDILTAAEVVGSVVETKNLMRVHSALVDYKTGTVGKGVLSEVLLALGGMHGSDTTFSESRENVILKIDREVLSRGVS